MLIVLDMVGQVVNNELQNTSQNATKYTVLLLFFLKKKPFL